MKNQKFTKSTAEIVYVSLALILGLLVVVFATSIRLNSGNFYPVGYDSYFNLRISQQMLDDKSVVAMDRLSNAGQNPGYFLGWPLMISFLSGLFGLTNTLLLSRLLPLIFSLLAFLVLYLLLRKLLKERLERILFLFLFVLSPPFIYMSVINTYYSFVMFIALLSFYLFLQERKFLSSLSLITISLIGFFSHLALILCLVIAGLFVLVNKKYRIRFLFLCAFSIGVFLIYFKVWLSKFIPFGRLFVMHTPDGLRVYGLSNISNFIAEFGGEFGLGLFILISALFGLFVIWKTKYKYFYSYFMVLILFAFSFYYELSIFFLNLFLIFLASIGLNKLIIRKFESSDIKFLIITLLLCGIVFDGVSYANSQKEISPSIREAEMMGFIRDRTLTSATIFSYYKNGDWISYAGKKNILDSNLLYSDEYYTRWTDSNTIFHPTNAYELKGLLDKYKVDYILIGSKENKIIYKNDKLESDELPLFLYTIKNDKSFRLVFRNFEVELYRYQKMQ